MPPRMFFRTNGEFSPMPPLKITASALLPAPPNPLLEVRLQHILLQHAVGVEERAIERDRMAHHFDKVVAIVGNRAA